MRVLDFRRALEQAGIDGQDAARLAETSGGSFTVFQRHFAGDVGITVPTWATGVEGQDLAPLLLAGAWDQNVSDDCQVIERLSGKPYSEVETFISRLRRGEDPPLRRASKIWEFVSPHDAWTLLYSGITSSQAEASDSIIRDPAILPGISSDCTVSIVWRSSGWVKELSGSIEV
jgi:hypothetical protein